MIKTFFVVYTFYEHAPLCLCFIALNLNFVCTLRVKLPFVYTRTDVEKLTMHDHFQNITFELFLSFFCVYPLSFLYVSYLCLFSLFLFQQTHEVSLNAFFFSYFHGSE